MRRYVESVSYWRDGATLELTAEGMRYGLAHEGARQLGRFAMALEGWDGNRGDGDIAAEIRAHCLAWKWLPPLRGRANPVDLEFHMAWPQNLVFSFWSVIRRCLRRR
jgi:hypothetical protein